MRPAISLEAEAPCLRARWPSLSGPLCSTRAPSGSLAGIQKGSPNWSRTGARRGNLKPLPRTSRLPETATGGGYGLYLVDLYSTAWGVAGNEGTCVWFELPVEPAAVEDD